MGKKRANRSKQEVATQLLADEKALRDASAQLSAVVAVLKGVESSNPPAAVVLLAEEVADVMVRVDAYRAQLPFPTAATPAPAPTVQ